MKIMKGFTVFGAAAILLLIVVIVGITGTMTNWTFQLAAVGLGPSECQDPGTARTLSVTMTDENYNPGTQITHFPMMIRLVGESVWTNVNGGNFGTAVAGEDYELALGVNATTATTAEPQPVDGPIEVVRIGCGSTTTESFIATNDELATSLVQNTIDPNDGNVITAADPVDIDQGSPISISGNWYAGFEENYGTLACGIYSNVLIVRVNSTAFEDVDVEYNGIALTDTTVPKLITSTTGFKDYAFNAPVIESTKTQGDNPYTYIIDPDDAEAVLQGTITGNITLTNLDSHIYIDGNTNTVMCGVEDELGNEIGAAATDTGSIQIFDD